MKKIGFLMFFFCLLGMGGVCFSFENVGCASGRFLKDERCYKNADFVLYNEYRNNHPMSFTGNNNTNGIGRGISYFIYSGGVDGKVFYDANVSKYLVGGGVGYFTGEKATYSDIARALSSSVIIPISGGVSWETGLPLYTLGFDKQIHVSAPLNQPDASESAYFLLSAADDYIKIAVNRNVLIDTLQDYSNISGGEKVFQSFHPLMIVPMKFPVNTTATLHLRFQNFDLYKKPELDYDLIRNPKGINLNGASKFSGILVGPLPVDRLYDEKGEIDSDKFRQEITLLNEALKKKDEQISPENNSVAKLVGNKSFDWTSKYPLAWNSRFSDQKDMFVISRSQVNDAKNPDIQTTTNFGEYSCVNGVLFDDLYCQTQIPEIVSITNQMPSQAKIGDDVTFEVSGIDIKEVILPEGDVCQKKDVENKYLCLVKMPEKLPAMVKIKIQNELGHRRTQEVKLTPKEEVVVKFKSEINGYIKGQSEFTGKINSVFSQNRIEVPQPIPHTGYKFEEWEDKNTGIFYTAEELSTRKLTDDITLYAKFVVDENQKFPYTVSYLIEGTENPVPGLISVTGKSYLGESLVINYPNSDQGYILKNPSVTSFTFIRSDYLPFEKKVFYVVDQGQKIFDYTIRYVEKSTNKELDVVYGKGYIGQEVKIDHKIITGYQLENDQQLKTLVVKEQKNAVEAVVYYKKLSNLKLPEINAPSTIVRRQYTYPVPIVNNDGEPLKIISVSSGTKNGLFFNKEKGVIEGVTQILEDPTFEVVYQDKDGNIYPPVAFKIKVRRRPILDTSIPSVSIESKPLEPTKPVEPTKEEKPEVTTPILPQEPVVITPEGVVKYADDQIYNPTIEAGKCYTRRPYLGIKDSVTIITSEEFKKAQSFFRTYEMTMFDSVDGFDPYRNLSREEAAKIFSQFAINVLCRKPDLNLHTNYSDVENADPTLKPYIELAYQLGVMKGSGMGDGEFRPFDYISKAEVNAVLIRMILKSYLDENQSIWYSKYNEVATTLGIITQGAGAGKVSRNDVALMLFRAYKNQVFDWQNVDYWTYVLQSRDVFVK